MAFQKYILSSADKHKLGTELKRFVKAIKLLQKVANDLVNHLHKVASSGEEVNARDLASKYTITVIANAGFGIDANCFEDCPRSSECY